jgi:hypothetical protein
MYNDTGSLEGSEAEPLETHLVEAHEDTAMPLWGSATSDYPMGCQVDEDVSRNNREYHKAFLSEYQKRTKPSVKIAKPDPVHHQCWQKYGHQMCVRDVPDVALANRMLKTMKSVQADKMPPKGLVIAHDMPLYLLKADFDAAAVAPSRIPEWSALRVFCNGGDGGSLCFLEGSVVAGTPGTVGSVVQLYFSFSALVPDENLLAAPGRSANRSLSSDSCSVMKLWAA